MKTKTFRIMIAALITCAFLNNLPAQADTPLPASIDKDVVIGGTDNDRTEALAAGKLWYEAGVVTGNVTVSTNTHSITIKDGGTLTVHNGATLTLVDPSTSSDPVIDVTGNGELIVLSGGTISITDANATIKLTGAAATTSPVVAPEKIAKLTNHGTIEATNGGITIGNEYAELLNDSFINLSNGGKLTVNSGALGAKIQSPGIIWLESAGGSLSINGGSNLSDLTALTGFVKDNTAHTIEVYSVETASGSGTYSVNIWTDWHNQWFTPGDNLKVGTASGTALARLTVPADVTLTVHAAVTTPTPKNAGAIIVEGYGDLTVAEGATLLNFGTMTVVEKASGRTDRQVTLAGTLINGEPFEDATDWATRNDIPTITLNDDADALATATATIYNYGIIQAGSTAGADNVFSNESPNIHSPGMIVQYGGAILPTNTPLSDGFLLHGNAATYNRLEVYGDANTQTNTWTGWHNNYLAGTNVGDLVYAASLPAQLNLRPDAALTVPDGVTMQVGDNTAAHLHLQGALTVETGGTVNVSSSQTTQLVGAVAIDNTGQLAIETGATFTFTRGYFNITRNLGSDPTDRLSVAGTLSIENTATAFNAMPYSQTRIADGGKLKIKLNSLSVTLDGKLIVESGGLLDITGNATIGSTDNVAEVHIEEGGAINVSTSGSGLTIDAKTNTLENAGQIKASDDGMLTNHSSVITGPGRIILASTSFTSSDAGTPQQHVVVDLRPGAKTIKVYGGGNPWTADLQEYLNITPAADAVTSLIFASDASRLLVGAGLPLIVPAEHTLTISGPTTSTTNALLTGSGALVSNGLTVLGKIGNTFALANIATSIKKQGFIKEPITAGGSDYKITAYGEGGGVNYWDAYLQGTAGFTASTDPVSTLVIPLGSKLDISGQLLNIPTNKTVQNDGELLGTPARLSIAANGTLKKGKESVTLSGQTIPAGSITAGGHIQTELRPSFFYWPQTPLTTGPTNLFVLQDKETDERQHLLTETTNGGTGDYYVGATYDLGGGVVPYSRTLRGVQATGNDTYGYYGSLDRDYYPVKGINLGSTPTALTNEQTNAGVKEYTLLMLQGATTTLAATLRTDGDAALTGTSQAGDYNPHLTWTITQTPETDGDEVVTFTAPTSVTTDDLHPTLTARHKGDALITATTAEGALKAKINVKVGSIEKVTISYNGTEVNENTIIPITGSTGPSGKPADIAISVTPAGAQPGVTLQSIDPLPAEGTIVATPGVANTYTLSSTIARSLSGTDEAYTFTLTFVSNVEPLATASVKVCILPVPVEGVALDEAQKQQVELQAFGGTAAKDYATLSAHVVPSDAANKSIEWELTDPSDAVTLTPEGVVTAQKPGTAIARAFSAEDQAYVSDPVTITVKEVKVSEVEALTTAPQTIPLTGDPAVDQLSVASLFRVLPANATTQTLTFESSDLNKATVDAATGLVTAKWKGDVKIIAKSVGLTTAETPATNEVTVTVTLTDAIVRAEDVEVTVGGNSDAAATPTVTGSGAVQRQDNPVTLQAFVTNDDGEKAYNQRITWTANPPDAARITEKVTRTRTVGEGVTYQVEFLKSGYVVIAGETEDGAIPIYVEFDVILPLTGIEIKDKASLPTRLRVGAEPLTLNYTPTPAGADRSTYSVAWNSNAPTVASVDLATGAVTPLTTGDATITLTATDTETEEVVGTDNVTFHVYVYETVSSVTIVTDGLPETLEVGEDLELSAELNEAATEDYTAAWTVEPAGAVTFNPATGRNTTNTEITAREPGEARITLTVTGDDTGQSFSDEVTVTIPVPPAISLARIEVVDGNLLITHSGGETTYGQQQLRGVITYYPEGSYVAHDSIWSIDKPEVATIDEHTGLVTAVNEGQALVTLTVTTPDGATVLKTALITVLVVDIPEPPVTPPSIVNVLITGGNVLEINTGEDGQPVFGTLQLEAHVITDPADAEPDYTLAWSIDPAEGVATIEESGLLTAVAAGDATVTLTVTETESEKPIVKTLPIKVVNILNPVTSVTLNGDTALTAELSLDADKPLTLIAEALPLDATYRIVTWEYDQTALDVTLSDDGQTANVYALKAGVYTITARSSNQLTATCTITVNEHPEPPLSPYIKDVIIKVGEGNLEISWLDGIEQHGTLQLDTVIIYEPEGETVDKTVAWSITPETVATIDAATGLITAQSKGEAVVTLTVTETESGTELIRTLPVTVTESPAPPPALGMKEVFIKGGSNALAITYEADGVTPVYHTMQLHDSITWLTEDTLPTSVLWSVTRAGVADIDPSGKVTAVGAGTTTIVLTVTETESGKSLTAIRALSVVEIPVEVTEVAVDTSALTLLEGETWQLTATLTPDSATYKEVSWTSSADSVATVEDGLVTAIAAGEAVITVTTINDLTATCIVTVVPLIPVDSVRIDQSDTTMNVRETLQLTATIYPANATERTIIWSSNTDVATVNPVTGQVTAVGEGYATIYVTTLDGGHKDSVNVTAVKVPVEDITIIGGDRTLVYDTVTQTAALQLEALIRPANATYTDVKWSSSDTTIAKVDSNGVVTGVREGVAVITATAVDGGYTATCNVTVPEIPVTPEPVIPIITAVAIHGAVNGDSLAIDSTLQLHAVVTVEPADSTIDCTVVWSSSHESIAAVDSAGLVTGVSEGEALIMLVVTTADSVYIADVTIAVYAPADTVPEPVVPVITEVTLYSPGGSSTVNITTFLPEYNKETIYGTLQLSASITYTPADLSFEEVVASLAWSSSNEAVATVDDAGLVTAVSAGLSTITLTVTPIEGEAISVAVDITVTTTGVAAVPVAAKAYIADNTVYVNSAVTEKVDIYTISGKLVYSAVKPAGETQIPLTGISDGVLIIRGASGWIQKIVK